MNFLVDAQLPPGLARWLAAQGHLSQHVQDLGFADAEDSTIWDYAISKGAVIVTKDEDFAKRTAHSVSGPVIVWLRIGNSTNSVLLDWIAPRWSAIVQLLNDGDRLVEVR